jgi:hypothetical protein
MPNYYAEQIYEGKEAIVVAIDIGTTQSKQRHHDRGEPDQSARCSIICPLLARQSTTRENGILKP